MRAPNALPEPASLEVERVYRDHFRFVWANLRRFGVPREQVEDACHDVFVVVHRRASDFDSCQASIRTWVFGIVRRVAADYRRTRQRSDRKLRRIRSHTVEDPRDSGASSVEARTLASELLGTLDEEHATIFVLSQLYGIPLREIADSLELNPNTVASRLRATRKRLESLAAEHERLTAEESPPKGAKARVLAGLCPLFVPPPPKPGPFLGLGATFVGVCVAVGIATTSAASGDGAHARALEFENPQPPVLLQPPVIPEVPAPLAQPPAPKPIERPRKAHRRPRPDATTPQPHPDHGTLREELALLTRARAAARRQRPADALRTANLHAERFPDGLLSAEIKVVRLDSLCQLGRTLEARALARKMRGVAAQRPCGRGDRAWHGHAGDANGR